MKRVLAATVILIVVAGACAASIIYQAKSFEHLLSMIDEIEDLYEKGDKTECLNMSIKFADECEKAVGIFAFFMRHNDIAPANDSAAIMPALLQQGRDDLFFLQLLQCKENLMKMDHQEALRMDNIL